MKLLLILFALLLSVVAEAGQPTNYKSGINIILGGTEGTAWKVEAPYWVPQQHDIQTIYIKDDTQISFSHNERNVATRGNSRDFTVIGANGLDGVAATGDEGIIRYQWDEHWGFRRKWHDSNEASVSALTNTLTASYSSRNNGDRLVVAFIRSGSSPLAVGQIYYVVNATRNTYQISETVGGTPVDLTTDGNVFLSFTAKLLPEYTAPFTIADSKYSDETSVLGSIGDNGGNILNKQSFFWKGISDDTGDEWHILKYGDDDVYLGGQDLNCSDGKHALFVVNPKTPCLSLEATGSGQFYTTPAWAYDASVIHDQTTYLTTDVTLTLTDLYAANISYRIDGGSWTTGAGPVSINSSAFSTGTHTLEYKSIRGTEPVKTRTIVKNPTHPCLSETHGNIWWGDAAGWTEITQRLNRIPYSTSYAAMKSSSGNGHSYRNILGQGWRLGTYKTIGLPPGGATGAPTNSFVNAFAGKKEGFNVVPSGSTQSYGLVAKRMMLESMAANPATTIEWTEVNGAFPADDIYFRGYYDCQSIVNAAYAYDLIAAGFRSDQFTDGLSPIEDLWYRDTMALWVYLTQMALALRRDSVYVSYASPPGAGMWDAAIRTSAFAIAISMPGYSTPYYGTSGYDGTETTYTFTPTRTTNHIWKTVFGTQDYAIGSYPDSLVQYFGIDDNNPNALIPPNGNFNDRGVYWNLLAKFFAVYWNLKRQFHPAGNNSQFYNIVEKVASGTPIINQDGTTIFVRNIMLFCNKRHATAGLYGIPYMQGLPSTDSFSDDSLISLDRPLTFIYYDDTYLGEGVPPTPPTAPTSLTATATSEASVALTWADNSSDETFFEVQRSLDNTTWVSSVQVAANATSYQSTGLTGSTLYYYRVRSGNNTGVSSWATASATTSAPPVVVPPPPTMDKRRPGRGGARGGRGPL